MWEFDNSRIALARQTRDMTQTELAQIISVNPQQLSQWERGTVKPGQDSLVKICNALQVPPKFFYINTVNFVNAEQN